MLVLLLTCQMHWYLPYTCCSRAVELQDHDLVLLRVRVLTNRTVLLRSVYQMMRGAEMLFAAVFSVVFLHRSLNRLHMTGILCCVVSAIFPSTVLQRSAFVHNDSVLLLVP